MTTLTIGQLAKQSNVNIDTIRYYERKDILQPVGRTDAGYRLYSQESVQQLNFVASAKDLGFTLAEISELLNLNASCEADCGDIKQQAQKKINEVNDKINNLIEIKKALESISEFCPGAGSPLSECSILKHLNGHRA